MKNLIQQLGEGGKPVARGGFQINQSQAHDTMERYQLVDPMLYVLELVQAAHLLGATAIEFDVDTDELDMRFDGAGLSAAELRNIRSNAFSRTAGHRPQARRHMAVALTALGALNPAEVLVTMPSSTSGKVSELHILGDEETIRERDPIDEEATDKHRIYVREKFRVGHILEFARNITGNHVEVSLLKERCRYATLPVTVNGDRVSRGHHLSRLARHETRVTWKGEKGLLGIRPDQMQEGMINRVFLVQNGVWTWSAPLEADLLGMEAMFETNRLTRDLSRAAFVQDADYLRLADEVIPRAYYKAMLEWVRSLEVTFINCDGLRRIATKLWREVLEPGDMLIEHRVLAKAMTRLPIWLDARNTRGNDPEEETKLVSVRELMGDDRDAPLLFADRLGQRGCDRPVFWRRPDVVEAFDVIGPYVERDWELVGERVITSRPQPTSLPEDVPHADASDDGSSSQIEADSEPTVPDPVVVESSTEQHGTEGPEVVEVAEHDRNLKTLETLQSGLETTLRHGGTELKFVCLKPTDSEVTRLEVGRLDDGMVQLEWDHPVAQYAREQPDDPIPATFLLSSVLTVVRHRCDDLEIDDERAMQVGLFETALHDS